MFTLIISILIIALLIEGLRLTYRLKIEKTVDLEMENGEIDVELVTQFGQRDLTESSNSETGII